MATLTPNPPQQRRPPRELVLNLPNQLTAGRLVLGILLFALIAIEAWGWCLAIFLLAAFTDWLDGYLARTQNQMSTLGRNLDPLVDKVLIGGAYIFLLPLGTKDGWLQPWMVTVVVARELIITSLRGYVESLGANFGADWLGKLKMVLQCAALIAVFLSLGAPSWYPELTAMMGIARDGLIFAMLAATLLSGGQYLARAALLLSGDQVG